MAPHDGLTHLDEHKIEGSNIELFGSEMEHRVREHAGDKESAWETAGREVGVQIWHIEQFKVVPWPDKRKGTFFSGDSYIVLHTYKKTPDSEKLSYDLHFWLGEDTSQDEAGTAAYKTVELDDRGEPVEYREVQGFESPEFLSYFPSFTILKGGVASGFHHVEDLPPPEVFRLYHIVSPEGGAQNKVVIREVSPTGGLSYGDVYVLDKGTEILQFNMKGSSGKERFAAADFTRKLANSRGGSTAVNVSEQGAVGAGTFLSALNLTPDRLPQAPPPPPPPAHLYQLAEGDDGQVRFSEVALGRASLDSGNTYILHTFAPNAVFVWIGTGSTRGEKKKALQYGQRFLGEQSSVGWKTSLVRIKEGNESKAFLQALGTA